MYIESIPNRNSPPAILLRKSWRDENGKVKKCTIGNLSSLAPEIIARLKIVLKGGNASEETLEEQFVVERSLPHGHVAAVLGMFRKIGMFDLITRNHCEERSLAAALIVARILEPASKLALSRQLSDQTATNTLAQELQLPTTVTEKDLYSAMSWLLQLQGKIEKRLAKKHLHEQQPILYDLTSTYYEGTTCVLAQRGYSRDGKDGTRQINFGLLCTGQGCPVAVEVFPGNTADPATVEVQLEKLKNRFGIDKVLLVGDRGMLTTARIEALKEWDGVSWISALKSSDIQKLAQQNSIQMELFDQRNLVEIDSQEDFPDERLVVCLNPALREERSRKRNELLQKTEEKLHEIARAVAREKNPYHGKDRIGRRVEREVAKYKMLKHFKLEISEKSLSFQRDEQTIAKESVVDGLYVVRAHREGTAHLRDEEIVRTYKSLSGVESAFRAIKSETLDVRPIFHRDEDMVRAHIFVCMLAYYLQWHLTQALKPVLFEDESKPQNPSPVAKAQRSEGAHKKETTKQNEDGVAVHSFKTLLTELSTLSRIKMRPNIENAGSFFKLSNLTRVQEKVFSLLNITPQINPCSQ